MFSRLSKQNFTSKLAQNYSILSQVFTFCLLKYMPLVLMNVNVRDDKGMSTHFIRLIPVSRVLRIKRCSFFFIYFFRKLSFIFNYAGFSYYLRLRGTCIYFSMIFVYCNSVGVFLAEGFCFLFFRGCSVPPGG